MQSRCCPRCEPTLMPRPRKIDDYLVRRLADLFHYADSLSFLSGIADYLRRRFARFKLGAHFLDVRCLLFKARRDSLQILSAAVPQ